MPRVKRGQNHLKKRKKILKQVKGYKWGRKKLIKLAKTAILKAGASAFRDRRNKKREFRSLWQIKIGAALRQSDLSYSRFIDLLNKKSIAVDRKNLADLAENNVKIFEKIVEEAR